MRHGFAKFRILPHALIIFALCLTIVSYFFGKIGLKRTRKTRLHIPSKNKVCFNNVTQTAKNVLDVVGSSVLINLVISSV